MNYVNGVGASDFYENNDILENLMENFLFCAVVLEKLKNSLFEILIISQTLNINNYRTTSAKSINLDIIRKLIEYSLKNVLVKAIFSLPVSEILLQEVGMYYDQQSGS